MIIALVTDLVHISQEPYEEGFFVSIWANRSKEVCRDKQLDLSFISQMGLTPMLFFLVYHTLVFSFFFYALSCSGLLWDLSSLSRKWSWAIEMKAPHPFTTRPVGNSHHSNFFFFFSRTWKFLGQGSNPSHSSASSHNSDNVKSLTCWATRELPHHTKSFFLLFRAVLKAYGSF